MSNNDLNWLEELSEQEVKAIEDQLLRSKEQRKLENSLSEFVKAAWHIVEPATPLIWNWHIDTICGYLEAVERGEIRKLIINIPPGTLKSLLASVFFPIWVWIRTPSEKFLCGSCAPGLALRDSQKMRLIMSDEWFSSRWGSRQNEKGELEDYVKISPYQFAKGLFLNTKQGHRESQGLGEKITGKRADYLIWDDPHDAAQANSDIPRQEVIHKWTQAWSSRVNSLDYSRYIIIMQRVHQMDITGHLLKNKDEQGWVLLAIPMRYDPEFVFDAGKDIGRPDLNDPRTEEGSLLFPERFSETGVRSLELDLGPYGSAGQLGQRPAPKGGGEFKKSWLNYYKTKPFGGNRYILVDPAGEKKSDRKRRDNTAMGVFEYCPDGNIYLIDAVRDKIGLIERTDILFKWHRQYKPQIIGYERYGMQSDIVHIKDRMERESYRFKIAELGNPEKKKTQGVETGAKLTSKVDRIRRLAPLFESGRIWLPETLHRTNADGVVEDIINKFIEDEYLNFPVAAYDDFFDMMSRLIDIKLVMPQQQTRRKKMRPRIMTDSGVGY